MQLPLLSGLLPEELISLVSRSGLPAFRAKQTLQWIWGSQAESWSQMTNLPLEVRKQLESMVRFPALQLHTLHESKDDQTTKFLWELVDGLRVESVLIRAPDRHTVCVSTQVGCPARCAFCASGRYGLVRNLEAAEIVDQVRLIDRRLRQQQQRVSHVVFMGMGEPLENFDEVVRAIRLLQHPDCLGLSPRRITVSTVGVVERIPQLAAADLGVSLVLSLHAPNQHLRRKIIPYARQVDLLELLDAIESYAETSKRDTTFEYILLAGLNDQPEHARELADLLRHRRGSVNLIPYNPVEGLRLQRPCSGAIARFRQILDQEGILNTCRYTKGDDIAAACGQLALQVDPALAVQRARPVGNEVAKRLLAQTGTQLSGTQLSLATSDPSNCASSAGRSCGSKTILQSI